MGDKRIALHPRGDSCRASSEILRLTRYFIPRRVIFARGWISRTSLSEPQHNVGRPLPATVGSGRHFATNHQDHQASFNSGAQHPHSDISLNTTNVYPSDTDTAHSIQDVDSSPSSHPHFVSPPSSQVHVGQRQWTGESISDTLRLERPGISTIGALLDHDNNTPATAVTTTQDSLQGSEGSSIKPVSGVTGTGNFRLQRWLLIVTRSAEL